MAKKPTKKQIREYLKHKLGTDEVWATEWLVGIYRNQTAQEQVMGETQEVNGEGFSLYDAGFLCSLTEQYLKYRSLSHRQREILLQKMPRYWRQVVDIKGEDEVIKCMIEDGQHEGRASVAIPVQDDDGWLKVLS